MRKLLFSIFSLLLVFPAGFPMAAEADTVLPFDTTVSGSISAEDPMDAYTITVPEAGTVTTNVKAYYYTVQIELRDSNNNLVGHSNWIYNGRPENPTSWTNTMNVEPGVYTLFVKEVKDSGHGDYSLNVSYEPTNNNETEPNQTMTQAMPLELDGDRVKGLISWNDSTDFYKLVVTEPGRIWLDVKSDMKNGVLELYDGKGNSIYHDTLGYRSEFTVEWKRRTDLEVGTYYFRVAGNEFNQGLYDIGASFIPANTKEAEPNNTRATAIPLITDGAVHTGFLSETDHSDYYKIEMLYDGTLTIDFTSEYVGYEVMDEGNTQYGRHFSSGYLDHPESTTTTIKLPKGTYYFIPEIGVSWQTGVYTMALRSEGTPPPPPKMNFMDVSSSYLPAVMYLLSEEVTSGIRTNVFGTALKIKRVDAAIWLAKILELDTTNETATAFWDVPPRAWGSINALKKAGIANGKSTTYFGANDDVTRGEMALMLQKAYNLSGDGVTLPFTDVTPRYETAIKALLKNDITKGKTPTTFGTNQPITRGEMAIFLYRADS